MNETVKQGRDPAGGGQPAGKRVMDRVPMAVVIAVVALAGGALWAGGPSGPAPGRLATGTPSTADAPARVALDAHSSRSAVVQPALREARPRVVQFEPNVGQSAQGVRYVAHGPGFTADVLDDGLRLHQQRRAPSGVDGASQREDRMASARLRFIGAGASRAIDPRERGDAVSNYLIGNDATRWLHNVPAYRQLRQAGVYPGIDLVYYGRDGAFEYDLVVHPHADASRIRLAVDGDRHPSIDAKGDLLLDGAGGALRMHRPVLYQHIDGVKKTLAADYVLLAANEVGFRLPAYDHGRPLIIDPTFKLLYSTYLGGVHDDQVGGMALDGQGNAYVVGNSGSEDWPVSGNAYQPKRKAIGRYVRNVVVTKFDASGNLVYSTFIGGSTNDYGVAIAVDAAGKAYVTGYTNSSDFPVTAGAFQTTFKGSQSAYLAALSPDGSSLAYSTLYGGTGNASGSGVAVETGGTVLVLGSAGPGLPSTAGAYKTSLASGNGAFLARFDLAAAGAAQLQAATYYGTDTPQTNFLGAGNLAYALALDAAGSPWLTGQAYTTNLPVSATPAIASPATMTASCSGGSVPLNSFAYVAHLSSDLKTLVYASYLTGNTGGPATCAEYGHGLAFDGAGNVYVGGSTSSLAYPTTAGALQATSPANSSTEGYAGFVTKLKADGSAILWSTYLGGNAGRTYLAGLTVDASSALWVSSTSAGGSNFPISADALQKTHGGGTFDAAFSKLDVTTGALLYSSFLGGGNDEGLAGFAVDNTGTAYIAGSTTSTNFPVTSTAFQASLTANAFDGADWFFTILGSGTIGRVLPASSGNGGDVTMNVVGVGLQPGASAALVSGATTISSPAGHIAVDGASETFGFALGGAAAGSYDLVVTNPDGTTITRKAAFTVQAAGAPVLSAQVLGRPKFRTGVPTTFQVVVSNTGTQEAIMVPLWITVPSSATVAIDNFSAAETAAMLAVSDAGKTYINRFIGKLSPGESTAIAVHLTTAADADFVPLTAALQAPWFRTVAQFNGALGAATYDSDCVVDSANAAYSNCLGPYENFAILGTRAFATGMAISPSDARIAAQRVRALGDPCKPLDHATEERDKGIADGKDDLSHWRGPGDDGSDFKRDVPNPAKDPIGWINYNAGYINGQFTVATGGGSGSSGRASLLSTTMQKLDGAACPVHPPTPPPTIEPQGSGGGGSGGSTDPNDKTGPRGDGSASHYIRADAALAYQVEFENQPTASLPAANVVVTDQLDPSKVDLSTFTLGGISFGNTTIDVPPGLSSYQTTVALSTTVSVRVQGSLDASTGLAKWTFTTLDPATRLPPSDPTLGFLPPDIDGRVGQGAVNFTVRQKSGAATGTVYSNFASVVFDANAAIVTPTWVNTVDGSKPTSKVQSLVGKPGTMDFDVTWSGSDAGSGVSSYTIYVSDSGAAWSVWQPSTTATTAAYSGVSGHSYGFYAVASDGAGNSEAPKSAAEATIAVSGAFADPTVGTSSSGGGGCSIGGDGRGDPMLPLLVILAVVVLASARRRAATTRRRAGD